MRFLPALVLAPSLALAAELPLVTVSRVEREHAGGSFTQCAVGTIDGRKYFLKSNRGSDRGTRYANFESDVLAGRLFERVGVRAPASTVVRLAPGSPLRRELGEVVLAMELVDSRFAGGRVMAGHWPGRARADIEGFARMLAVDLVIGNGDRRGANFFVVARHGEEGSGSRQPVPIDNNCGFSTMLNWTIPSSQLNFFPTYDGVADQDVLRDLGTIRNLVADADVYRILLGHQDLRQPLRRGVAQVHRLLDDAFLDEIVEELPPEIIPPEVRVDPQPEWKSQVPADALAMLFAGLTRAGRVDRIGGGSYQAGAGAHLFALRKAHLKAVLRWRRDHLSEALVRYLAWHDRDPDALAHYQYLAETWENRGDPPAVGEGRGDSSGWAH